MPDRWSDLKPLEKGRTLSLQEARELYEEVSEKFHGVRAKYARPAGETLAIALPKLRLDDEDSTALLTCFRILDQLQIQRSVLEDFRAAGTPEEKSIKLYAQAYTTGIEVYDFTNDFARV